MAPNVTAAAAHIAYDMQPPESLHRTKYQIKAKKNQDLEHTELEMLITMNVHIPLPNPYQLRGEMEREGRDGGQGRDGITDQSSTGIQSRAAETS